jgi:hypothetical protein
MAAAAQAIGFRSTLFATFISNHFLPDLPHPQQQKQLKTNLSFEGVYKRSQHTLLLLLLRGYRHHSCAQLTHRTRCSGLSKTKKKK